MAARASDSDLLALMRTIDAGERDEAARRLAAAPALARACLATGATRQGPDGYFLERIRRHLYTGDTALHVAAAVYWKDFAKKLVAAGADLRARNRRGAEPLHAAAVGGPGSATWNPPAQAATIAWLIGAGADPNAVDMDGVTPLHRAVRTRCAAAVAALLKGGADAERRNDSGSTPLRLARLTTGRSGSGAPDAQAQQQEILRLLERHGARR
jgi:Ankyrin repeats (many copies)/Ankyrin repeat